MQASCRTIRATVSETAVLKGGVHHNPFHRETETSMRITFVLPYAGLQGGIRVVAIYAERLVRRGHTVTVISDPQQITIRDTVKGLLRGTGLPQPEPSHFDGIDVEH